MPFLTGKGEEFMSEGHPFGELRTGLRLPAKALRPSGHPIFISLLDPGL